MVFSKLFGGDKSPIVGLDVAEDFIKLAKLSKENGGVKVEILARKETPDGAVLNGVITEPLLIAEAVKAIIAEKNIGNAKYNIAVPGNVPFFNTITLPDLPLNEIRTIAEDEAGKFLPIPVKEANIEAIPLDPTKRSEDSKKMVDVLVVGLQKSVAQKYLDMADEAKIVLNSIEMSPFSMIKTLAYADQITPEKGVINVSVSMGYENTDITITTQGMPLFCHCASVGKRNLLEHLKTTFNLELKDAEEFLPEIALLVPGQPSSNDPIVIRAATALRVIFNTLCSEITKAIEFYKSQKSYKGEINKIFLGGSGMCVQNADKFISNRLRIETEFVKTFEKIDNVPEFVSPQEVPTYATVIGLALKGMNVENS